MLSDDVLDVIGRTAPVRLRLGADRGVEAYAKGEALGPGGSGARADNRPTSPRGAPDSRPRTPPS
ncbi:hypothetical protein [Streptomyces cellulosae]|uniref:Uncharacterized protein n=1 Tax=Streptomyces cellulosae TaxID=1968 RepID=A0ABW7YGB8_STRCE